MTEEIKEKKKKRKREINDFPDIFVCHKCKIIIAHHDRKDKQILYNGNIKERFKFLKKHKCGSDINLVVKNITYKNYKGYI